VSHSTQLGKKTLHHFSPQTGGKLTFQAVLWFASEKTLVVGLSKGSLEEVPDQPTKDLGQLPAPVLDLLKGPMGGSKAWLAGNVEKWELLGFVLAWFLEKDVIQTLSQFRTFGFWLSVDGEVNLQGTVQCADEQSTKALAEKWSRFTIPQGD